MKDKLTEHLVAECAHAILVRRGKARPLGERDPVPGCRCPRCVLLGLHARGEIDAAVVDLLLSNVLPALASLVPTERPAVARQTKIEWAEAAMLVLPAEELLITLAARIPGARKAQRPVSGRERSLPLEEARFRPILEVADGLGLELKRTGRSWRGACPIHGGDGPNFSVDPKRGLFRCFVCGARGDGIELYRRVVGVGFAAAVREIAR